MSGEWLTYRKLAEKLGVSVEVARRRAQRARWSRQSGNDGKARVLLPEDYEIERRPDGTPDVRPDAAPAQATIAALEAALAADLCKAHPLGRQAILSCVLSLKSV